MCLLPLELHKKSAQTIQHPRRFYYDLKFCKLKFNGLFYTYLKLISLKISISVYKIPALAILNAFRAAL